MIQDKGAASMRHDRARPSTLDHALDVVAKQQGEYDSRRRRFLGDEKRRQAAVYEENSLHHPVTLSRFLPSGQEPTVRFASSVVWDVGPVRGEIARASGDALQAQPQAGLSGQEKAERYFSATRLVTLPADLYRTTAAHDGLVKGIEPSDPTRLLGAATANERHEARPGAVPRSDPITQLASRYTESLDRQLAPVVQQHLRLGREDQFTRDLSDILTSGQVHAQAARDAIERESRSDKPQSHGRDQRSQSLRLAYHAAQVERMISSEITHDQGVGASVIDSIVAGVGEMFGHGDQRGNPSDQRSTFGQGGGWNTDNSYFATTATNSPAQDATAAVADEIERLRVAVRRTIDELEKVRGSVQPPLPTLPLNRGAFRIA
jgi:hypothetical protein